MATGSPCKCPQSPLLSPAFAWVDKTGLPNIILPLARFETDLSTADSFKLSHPCHASHALGAEVPAESDVLPRAPKIHNILRSPHSPLAVARHSRRSFRYVQDSFIPQAVCSMHRCPSMPGQSLLRHCRVGTLGRGHVPFVSWTN
jgi:hypothetical protein